MEVAIVGVYNLSRLSAFGGITAVPSRSPDVFKKEREFMPSYVRHESVDEHKRCRLIARFFCGRDGMVVTSGNEGGKSNRISSLPVLLIIPLGRDPMGGNSGVIAYKVAAQGSLLSRRHCVLQLCSSNSLHIPHTIHEWCALSVRDCGSLNGTFVNGRRLASGAVSTPVIFDPCDVNAWNEPLLTLELGAGAKLVAGDSLSRSQLQLRFHIFVRCLFLQEQAAWIRRRLEGSCVDMTEKHVSSVCTKDNHLDDMSREEKLRREEHSLEQGPVLVNKCNAVSTRNSSGIMRSVCQREVFSNDEQHSNLKRHNDKKSEISPFSISLIYGNESRKKDNLTATVPLGVFTNTHVMTNILTASNSSKHMEKEKGKKDSVVVNQESDVRDNTDKLPPRINTEIPGGNLKTFNYGVSEKSPDQEQQENSIEETIPNLSPVLIKKKKTLIDSPDTHDSLNNRYTKGNLAPSAVKVSESSAGATLLPYNSQSLVDVLSLEDKMVQVNGEKKTSELSQEEVLNIRKPVPHNFNRTKSESLSLPTSQDDRVIALPRRCVIKQEKSPQDDSCITVNKTPPSIDCQVSSVGVVSYKEPPIQTLTKRSTKRKRTTDVKETVKNFMAELREGPTKTFSSEKSEPSITAAAVLRSGLEIGALAAFNSESKSLVNTSEQVDMGSDHLLGRNNFSSVTDERGCITTSSTNSQLVVHAPKHTDAEMERKKNMGSTTILQKRPNHLIVSNQISGNNAKKVSRLKVAEKKRQRLACVISAIDQCSSNLEWNNETKRDESKNNILPETQSTEGNVPRCTHHYSSGVTHLEHFNPFYKLAPVCYVPQELHLGLRENQLEGLRFIWSHLLCEPQTFAQQTKSVMTKLKGDTAFCTSTSSEKQVERNFSIQKSNNTLTSGCVFSSTMGFGNSFITIAFLYIIWSFLRVNPNHCSLPLCLRKGGTLRPVICVSKEMLLHWLREITYCSHIVKKENEKREESVKVFCLDSEDCAVDKVALLRRWAKDSSNQTILLLSHTTFTHLMMSPSMTSKPSASYSASSTCSDNNTAVSPPVRKNGGAREKVTNEEEEKEGVRGRRKKKQKIEIEEMYWIDGSEKEGDEMQKKSNQVDGIEKGKEKDLVLGDSEIYAEGREILLTHCTLFVLDEAHKIIDDRSLLLDALRKLSPHILRLALTNITRLDISRPCVTQEVMSILQFILPTLWENENLNSPAQLPQYFKSFFHLCNMDTLIQEGIFFCETSIVTYLSPHQSNMLRDLVMLMQEHGTIPVKNRLTFASRFWMISSYGDMLANHSNCSESHNITTANTIREQNIAGGKEEMVSYLLPTLLLPYPLKNREEMEQLLENSWKMKGLFMLLNEALKRQEKVVVFSHSLKTLTLVAVLLKYLRNFVNGVDFAVISSVLPLSEQEEVCMSFQKAGGTMNIILVTFQSCSYMLDFSNSNRLIFFDTDYSSFDVEEEEKVLRACCFGYNIRSCTENPPVRKTVYVNRLVSSHPLEVASMHLEGSHNIVGNTVVWRASCMLDTTTNILEKYNKNNSDDPVIMFMRRTCPDIIAATI